MWSLYEIHQDLIEKGKKLREECQTDSIRNVVNKINVVLESLKKNNTVTKVVSHRESLKFQGKDAANSLKKIKINNLNVADVIKLRDFFNDVAEMFGNPKYKGTIFEEETFTLLNKSANLKDISLAFAEQIDIKLDKYQQEKKANPSPPQLSIEISPSPSETCDPIDPSSSDSGPKTEYVSLKKSKTVIFANRVHKTKDKIVTKVTETLEGALAVFEMLGKFVPVSNRNKKEVLTPSARTQEPKKIEQESPITQVNHRSAPAQTARNATPLPKKSKTIFPETALPSTSPNITPEISVQAKIGQTSSSFFYSRGQQMTMKDTLQESRNIEKKNTAASSDNLFSDSEKWAMLFVGLTGVGLVLVAIYAIYKTCCTSPTVDESEEDLSAIRCS